MDKFRTRVDIAEPAGKMGYKAKSLWMGSCFSDTIGKIMAGHKFPVLLNPFGTLFNPFSVMDNLRRLISGHAFTSDDLHYNDGLWFSFSHYTGFAHPDADACLSAMNDSLKTASDWLKQSDFLLLTFGTSRIYQLKESGLIVANCHKIPSVSFTSRLAEPAEIIQSCDVAMYELRQMNPAIQVIFTLSPVRHWSDGAESNQLSKSILHYSMHEILKKYDRAHYFPAYEIFMDELRDYRFYAADMLHPSEQASRYIWERFTETWIDKVSQKIMADVTAVMKAAGHRPLHAESTNHKQFKHNTLQQIEHLTAMYPFLDFSNEIALLQL